MQSRQGADQNSTDIIKKAINCLVSQNQTVVNRLAIKIFLILQPVVCAIIIASHVENLIDIKASAYG